MSVLGRMVLPCVVVTILGLRASSAGAQVWVDETQLAGRLPEWVDRNYYTPPAPVVEPAYRNVTTRIWVPPVYRTVCTRVWREQRTYA